AAQSEGERLEVLAGRQIHLVGQVAGVEHHVLGQRLLRLLDDLLALRLEEGLELLELRLVHVRFPIALPPYLVRAASPRRHGARDGRFRARLETAVLGAIGCKLRDTAPRAGRERAFTGGSGAQIRGVFATPPEGRRWAAFGPHARDEGAKPPRSERRNTLG